MHGKAGHANFSIHMHIIVKVQVVEVLYNYIRGILNRFRHCFDTYISLSVPISGVALFHCALFVPGI